ncbi:MAG TPA: BlaI/MecI/CopY family transcriptional regulator [Polyangiaceae bacterium]|nr:BlaI/MecI/CopY family transcriptional regulator [Polyangiaceae bacterium]
MSPVRPPLLGELESAVMEFLWAGGEGEAKAVHKALGRRRGIGLNTVQSTLKRLYDKELLERDKVSHAHVYRPRVTREQFQCNALDELVGELMRGEASAMVSAFVELTERAGPEHLDRLEQLLKERRSSRSKERP